MSTDTAEQFIDRCIAKKIQKYGADWVGNPNQQFPRKLPDSEEEIAQKEAKIGK